MPGDFDRFEAPSYSTEDLSLAEPSIGDRLAPITDELKKRKGLIIGIIIIAIIGYFAYDFFIGSYRTMEFSFKDTEGSPVTVNQFKVFDSANNLVLSQSGGDSFSVKLKPGEYQIEAKTSSGYKTITKKITVSDNAKQTIEFEKTIKAQITGFAENFPKTLVAGQKAEFEISVQNNASSSQEIEFVISEELQGIGLEIPKITVAGNDSEKATVSISVPSDYETTATSESGEETQGKELTGNIRIKFTKIQADVPSRAKVFPTPILELSPTTIDIYGNAGESQNATFEIINQGNFTVEDLNLSLEITSSSKNSKADILAGLSLPDGTKIDSIEAAESGQNTKQNTLRYDIPITAKQESGILGNIIISGKMLPEEIKIPITISINQGAIFGIDIMPTNTSPTVQFDEDGIPEKLFEYIDIANNGQLDIENIRLRVKNSSSCDSSWLKLEDTSAPLLKRQGEINSTKKMRMTISAPITAVNNQKVVCIIEATYQSPVSEEDVTQTAAPIEIIAIKEEYA